MGAPYARLRAQLRDHGLLADATARRYAHSTLRYPSAVERTEVVQWCLPIIESLADALSPTRTTDRGTGSNVESLTPGAMELREVEQASAFLGSRAGATRSAGFDIAALFVALGETLCEEAESGESAEIYGFVQWLMIIALDAFATARERAANERYADDLEEGTPIVLVLPDVIAVFLLGRPTRAVVEHVVGRLLLRIARVGARAVVIDGSGLRERNDFEPLAGLAELIGHPKVAGRTAIVLCGLEITEDVGPWRPNEGAAAEVLSASTFEEGLEKAYERSEFSVIRRRSQGTIS